MTAQAATRDATAMLAEHVAGLRYAALAPQTVEHAKQAVLDCIGIAIRAGCDADSTPAMVAAVEALDAGGRARVVGTDRGYQPQYAALLNATFAHTLDFDDTHVGGSIHPGAPTIPAALAIGEVEHRSGADLIAAVVAGYDVVVRLSEALTPKAQYDRGFHPTGTCGTFGAAAAVASLAGDGAGTIASAFGIALSAAAGTMQYLANGSWNKRFHVGFAAHDGIVAERFARAGVVGAADAFEGRFGFRHSYAGAGSFDGLAGALAGGRAIDETAFKPYPSCRYTHAALDELIELQREHALEPDAIERVTIGLPRVSWALVKDPEGPKRDARTVVDGQFSMFFTAAVALLKHNFTWDDYALLGDPEVRRMAARIEIVEDPDIEALGQSMAARITCEAGGRVYRRFARAPKGEPDRPLGWSDIALKFDGLASARYDVRRREQILDVVTRLEEIEDVGTLTALLGA